jgi:hypothetical protein
VIATAVGGVVLAGGYFVGFAKPRGWSVTAIPCDPQIAKQAKIVAALGEPLGCDIVSTHDEGRGSDSAHHQSSIRIYGPRGRAVATSDVDRGWMPGAAPSYAVTLPDGSVVHWTAR